MHVSAGDRVSVSLRREFVGARQGDARLTDGICLLTFQCSPTLAMAVGEEQSVAVESAKTRRLPSHGWSGVQRRPMLEHEWDGRRKAVAAALSRAPSRKKACSVAISM